MKPQLEFKKNKRGQWFWHFRAKNGRIVADSAESYSSKAKAMKGFRSLAKSLQGDYAVDYGCCVGK